MPANAQNPEINDKVLISELYRCLEQHFVATGPFFSKSSCQRSLLDTASCSEGSSHISNTTTESKLDEYILKCKHALLITVLLADDTEVIFVFLIVPFHLFLLLRVADSAEAKTVPQTPSEQGQQL